MKSLFPSHARIQKELASEDGTSVRSLVDRERFLNFPEVDNITYGPARFAKEMAEQPVVAVYPNDPSVPKPDNGYDMITGLNYSSDTVGYNPPLRDRAGFNGFSGTGSYGEYEIDQRAVEDADASGNIRKQNLDSIALMDAETYSFEDQTNQFARNRKPKRVSKDPMHMNDEALDDGRNMAVNYSPSFYDHSDNGTYVRDDMKLQIEELGTPITDIEDGTTSKVAQFNQLPLFNNTGFLQNRFTQAMNNTLAEEDRLSRVGTNKKRPLGQIARNEAVNYSFEAQTNQDVNQSRPRRASKDPMDMEDTELDDGRNMAVNYSQSFYPYSEDGTYIKDTPKLQMEEIGTPITDIEAQTEDRVAQFNQLPLFNNTGFLQNRFTQAMNNTLAEEDRLYRVGTNARRPLGNDATSGAVNYSFVKQTNQDTNHSYYRKFSADPMDMADTQLDDGRSMAVNYSPSFYNHSDDGTYVIDTPRLQMEEIGTPIEEIERQTTSKVDQFDQLPLFNNRGFMNNRFTQAMNTFLSEEDRLSQIGNQFHRPLGLSFDRSTMTQRAQQSLQQQVSSQPAPVAQNAKVYTNLAEIFTDFPIGLGKILTLIQDKKDQYTAKLNELQPQQSQASSSQPVSNRSQQAAAASRTSSPTYSASSSQSGLKGTDTVAITKADLIKCLQDTLGLIKTSSALVGVILKANATGAGYKAMFSASGSVNEIEQNPTNLGKLAQLLSSAAVIYNKLKAACDACDAKIYAYEHPGAASTYKASPKQKAKGIEQVQEKRGGQRQAQASLIQPVDAKATSRAQSSTESIKQAMRQKEIKPTIDPNAISSLASRSKADPAAQAAQRFVDASRSSSIDKSGKQADGGLDSRSKIQVKGSDLISAWEGLFSKINKLAASFDAIKASKFEALMGAVGGKLSAAHKANLNSFAANNQSGLTKAINLIRETKTLVPGKNSANALITIPRALIGELNDQQKKVSNLYSGLDALIRSIKSSPEYATIVSSGSQSGGSSTQQGGGSTQPITDGSSTQQGGGATQPITDGGSTQQGGGATQPVADGGSTQQGGGSTQQQGGSSGDQVLYEARDTRLVQLDQLPDAATRLLSFMSAAPKGAFATGDAYPYLRRLAIYLANDIASGILSEDLANAVMMAQFVPLTDEEKANALAADQQSGALYGYPRARRNARVLGSTAGEYNSLNQYKPNPRYSDIAKQGDLLSVEDYNQVKNDVLSQLATQPDSNTQDQLIADVPQEQAAISMSDNIEVMEEQVGATKSNTTLYASIGIGVITIIGAGLYYKSKKNKA